MVECSFCGKQIGFGTGKIYARKDGVSYNLCSNKCEKNLINMKRKPVKTKWTNAHNKLKSTLHVAKEDTKSVSKKTKHAVSSKGEDTAPSGHGGTGQVIKND